MCIRDSLIEVPFLDAVERGFDICAAVSTNGPFRIAGRDDAAVSYTHLDVYKRQQLERSRTRYKIVEETVQPDDSILIKIKQQYNHHDCGDYMD